MELNINHLINFIEGFFVRTHVLCSSDLQPQYNTAIPILKKYNSIMSNSHPQCKLVLILSWFSVSIFFFSCYCLAKHTTRTWYKPLWWLSYTLPRKPAWHTRKQGRRTAHKSLCMKLHLSTMEQKTSKTTWVTWVNGNGQRKNVTLYC